MLWAAVKRNIILVYVELLYASHCRTNPRACTVPVLYSPVTWPDFSEMVPNRDCTVSKEATYLPLPVSRVLRE